MVQIKISISSEQIGSNKEGGTIIFESFEGDRLMFDYVRTYHGWIDPETDAVEVTFSNDKENFSLKNVKSVKEIKKLTKRRAFIVYLFVNFAHVIAKRAIEKIKGPVTGKISGSMFVDGPNDHGIFILPS